MNPQQMGGEPFYVAEGAWNLLGGFTGSFLMEPRIAEIVGCGGWI
jgi:hypothetical protein